MRAFTISLLLLTLVGCTKYKLEKFNNRIAGNWNLVEINTFGLGSSHIVFNGGSFSFRSDNSATYYDRNNTVYNGTWYIDAYTHTDSEGDSDTEFILTIDVANGNSIKFDKLEIPRFGNANRFKAKVYNAANVVTYVFERH
ncbi:MAG TPA: hypothetical protein PKE30_03985 [Niabella sp.]|nr:hypothetical protein [Niabella sp.]